MGKANLSKRSSNSRTGVWKLTRLLYRYPEYGERKRIYPLVCSHWIAGFPRYKDLPRGLLTKLARTGLLLRTKNLHTLRDIRNIQEGMIGGQSTKFSTR
jgi:hypothetical protein